MRSAHCFQGDISEGEYGSRGSGSAGALGNCISSRRPHRRPPCLCRRDAHLRRRRRQHRRSLRRRVLPVRPDRRTCQARVLRGRDGRRIQPRRQGVRGRGRDVRWRFAQPHSGVGGGACQPGSGAGAGRAGAYAARRTGQLPGHQWLQRLTERRGSVRRHLGVLRARDQSDGHRRRTAPRHRGRPNRRARGAVAAQEHSTGDHHQARAAPQRPSTRSAAGRQPASTGTGIAQGPWAGHDRRRRASGSRRREG
ncbi:hypothetical protein BN978_06210 [Mycolicibacterium mageritense DSM 44476 = CIP 104973]|nr:hypothetical protein BN978_06210 [Mycolicibacterium mageritense DSM 44476 = CIP 104973]